jgi:hypothetical protein
MKTDTEHVPVIAVEDKDLGADAADHLPKKAICNRFKWYLSKRVDDDESGNDARDVFNRYKAFLSGEGDEEWGKLGKGSVERAVLLIDLNILIGGLNSEEKKQVAEWVGELPSYNNHQVVGLFMVGVALSNPDWSGVIVVATDAWPSGFGKHIEELEAAHNNSKVDLVPNGGAGLSTEYGKLPIEKGIETFDRRFCPHGCSDVASALSFWSKPWVEEWSDAWWKHDELDRKESDHRKSVEDWLGREVGGEEAKGLLLWPKDNAQESGSKACKQLQENWHGEVEYRSGRPIRGGVLRKVFDRLGIPAETELKLQDEEEYILPCEPAFPFLVSLRNLLCVMEKGDEKAPPKEITLQKREGDPTFYMLRLALSPYYETDEGERKFFKRWGLAKRYFQFDRRAWGGEGLPAGKRTTTRALNALTYARTPDFRDSYLDDFTFMPLFRQGVERQVVSVSFGPQAIHLLWTSE